jgi:hypothetical protein
MYRRSDVLAKLREKRVIDLSDAELDRKFKDVVGPGA